MARRPERIDIPGADPLSRPLFTPHGNPITQSDVPPALSPLDAFAMQGRLLAKRFEEENNTGRRISRLPTVTIASELAKARPEYFRAMTTGSQHLASPSQLLPEEASVQRSATEVQSAPRPLSHYPQMILTDSLGPGRGLFYQTQLGKVPEAEEDLAIPRSRSPEDLYTAPVRSDISRSPPLPPANSSKLCVTPTKFTIGPSLMSYPAPAVPKPPSMSPSIRPVYDDDVPSLEASVASLSLEKSRTVAESAHMLRTSSTNSDKSLSGTPPRPSFNYSRPMSHQGPDGRRAESPPRPSGTMRGPPLDTIYRQDSAEAPTPAFLNDSPQTPVSLASEELFATPDARTDSTPASFVYAKYALPTKPKRESLGISEFINKQFAWDDAGDELGISFANAPFLAQTPPSPALTGSPSGFGHEVVITGGTSSPARSLHSRKRLQKSRPGTPSGATPAAAESALSLIKPTRQASKTSPPPTTNPTAPAAPRDPAAEEHLQRGIELHEQGALQESTYHLRIAAMAGHPTAMVLYALACRHGWGMKPAPEDGVAWLTRAVESSHLELAEDERKAAGPNVRGEDVANRRANKAQFALGVYELGQSYMNGWGVAQDRALGVRCFEIAGAWGDADGLAAAAHCYMEGIGVRKDLRKSARLFRQAEAKGVNVAGNSW
jgi:TPR repeat protein